MTAMSAEWCPVAKAPTFTLEEWNGVTWVTIAGEPNDATVSRRVDAILRAIGVKQKRRRR